MDQYNLLNEKYSLKSTKGRPAVMLKVVGASWEKTRMISIMLIVVLIIAVFAVFYEVPLKENDGHYSASVLWSIDNGFKEVYWGQNNNPINVTPGVARAYYKPDMTSTGWSTLEIQTQPEYPDWVQAYSAGLLEGSLCWQLIYWHWQNTVATICKNRKAFCAYIRESLEINSEYTRKMAAENDKISPKWHQINLFFTQLDGLESGWRNGVLRSRKDKVVDIPKIDFLWMNSGSDVKDLEQHYNTSRYFEQNKLIKSIAFIKYMPNTRDQFLLAHEAVGYYTEMLRLHKRYDFGYHMTSSETSALTPGKSMVFTSHPATLYSSDDFYQIYGDKMFTVAGVSITNYNKSLWNETQLENKLLLAPRVVAANRLSSDGDQWGEMLSFESSGTGNKHWLVVTGSNRSEQNNNVEEPLTLWIIEQIPSATIIKNKTSIFKEQGYWINVGLPYYETIQNLTGYTSGLHNTDNNRTKLLQQVSKLLEDGSPHVNDDRSMTELMRHPQLTAAGRNDIAVINFNETDDAGLPKVVGDLGFTVHYTYRSGLTNNNKNLGGNINQIHGNNFKDFLKATTLDKEIKSSVRSLENRLKWEQEINKMTKAMAEENDAIIDYGGIIDLKVADGHDGYLGLAGPPFNPTYRVDPFCWSTSFIQTIPHYGQVDLWNFEPVRPIWVW